MEEAQNFARRCAPMTMGPLLGVIPVQLAGLLRCNMTHVLRVVQSHPQELYVPEALRVLVQQLDPDFYES